MKKNAKAKSDEHESKGEHVMDAKHEMAEVKKKLPGGKGYKYEYAMKMHQRKS